VEYQQYKEAATRLEERETRWRDVFRRAQELPPTEPEEVQLGEISLFDLLTALRDVLERVPDESIMELTVEALTVRDRMTQILERLDRLDDPAELRFDQLFDTDRRRIAVIVTFLALLELVKIHVLGLRQAEAGGAIILVRLAPAGAASGSSGEGALLDG
jgi:segregation and condensation protein A